MIRNVLVIFVGILVYGEETSANELVGYLFALLGFVLYNLAKMNAFGATATGTGTGTGASGDKRLEASGGGGSGEGGKYGSGGGADTGADSGTESGANNSDADSSSGSGGGSSCCGRWLSIFRLHDLEREARDQEGVSAQILRHTGIYPGFNWSPYAPAPFAAASPSGSGSGAGSGSMSMVRLANLTGGKQRNLQSFSKDSDCEEAGADSSETSRLLTGGGSGKAGGGGGDSGSGSGVSGSSGDASNRKKRG